MDLIKCLEEMCREIICVKSLCLLPEEKQPSLLGSILEEP